MSVYNGADYIVEAIDSILNQSFTDFEFLIIDDGSTDCSRDIIRSYSDPRINMVENESNIGLPASLNRGIGLARGGFIARQDADDISLPTRLEEQVDYFDQTPDCALIGCSWELIDQNSTTFGSIITPCGNAEIIEGLIPNRLKFPHGCYLFRKEAVETIGGYDERFFYTQDYDLLLRMSKTFTFGAVPSVLYRFRATRWKTNFKILCQAHYRAIAQEKYANEDVAVHVPTISELESLLVNEIRIFKNVEARYWYSLARETWRLGNTGRSAQYLAEKFARASYVTQDIGEGHHIIAGSGQIQLLDNAAHDVYVVPLTGVVAGVLTDINAGNMDVAVGGYF